MTKRIILLLFCFISLQNIFAQCTDGTQPECQCSTAPVLCTVDDLDNYMFSMSSYQHPQDGPQPLCPGANNTVPNNPTWFAFTAWCTDLTLEASFSNCTAVGNSIGVQIAIYEDCTFTNAVACNVNANDCNTNSKTLTMTGLTIGGVYYFLVDGCLGSYCDVTIDIIGTCGQEEIAPWTQGVTGETNACGGNTETYSVETLTGAATYHWFVDGILVGTSSTPTFDIAWATSGSYQLCIDASNDPCVPITDLPVELCTTINVYESEAGTITAPTSLCPNEVANISVAGYNMGADNAHAILITDASGVILEVISGSTGTYTSMICGTFTIYSYNYIPSIGTAPVVGNNVSAFDCAVECCDLESMTLSFEDTQPPVFPNPPADATLTCVDLVPMMMDLGWTDNCDGMGTVAGTESGSADACNGGTITRTWDYTDGCGNNATYTQTITVSPAPAPTFTNPPADQTVTCDNIPTNAPDLNYTNNAMGACEISGMVSPTQSGTADICGGTISFTWDLTDLCGNTISHTQNITVTPAAAPVFLNPPADIVVTCDNIPTSAPDLDYTNNENGSCLVMGTVSPTQSGTADMCGGSFSFVWDFTDVCGNSISHTQNITVTPPAAPVFINPPADIVVTCDNIPTSAPDLDYTNNENGSCLVMGTVSPTQSGTADMCGGSFSFVWDFTDVCGNSISHTQNITVTPPAAPVFINPPADLVVTCDNIPTSAPDLDYTNNENGSCLVMGTVSPTQSGTADICGGAFSFIWDFTDMCGNSISHTQNITVTPSDAPTFINPPADLVVTCSNIPTGAPDLNYTNNENGTCLVMGTVSPTQSGSADECGGTISYTWTFTDFCNNTITHVQNYTVTPAPPATFIGNLPSDITVDCDNVPGIPSPLQYTNNETGFCVISGFAPASQSGSYDECGGLIVFLWQFTDACGRSISYTQNVTVDPAPPAVFTNPPSGTTLDCSSVPSILPTLGYTNNQTGPCSINGSVTAIQSGFYDACGGNITYTWTFTDDCNRSISHAQNVVVIPASDPMFTSMPPDMTINCGEPFPNPINLPYTNNESGNCAITGTVPATVTSNGNGGMEYTWTFTNPCNNFTITHTQVIDQTPSPDITINPTIINICEGEMFDLSTIAVTDLNNTNPNITFHSGTPATIGNQLSSPIVSPLVSTTYYILASNSFGCSDETSFDVIVEEPPFAGFDGMGEICYNTPNNINLFSYLSGSYTPTGTWVDTYGYGVNLSNPNNISLQGLPAGTYTFDYFVASGGVCPDDVASVTLEYLPEIFIAPFDIVCAADPNFYEVSISNFGFDIIVLAGTYSDLGNNMGIVTGIPISQSLVIIATNPSNFLCTFTLNISPPDCNCPNVDPPVSNGDAVICEGETTPELSVAVGADETANWYDTPSGGALLQSGSTTFTPSETTVGTYIYYVETENLTSGCVSLTLTPIEFDIAENPSGNNAQLEACDLDGDGFVAFDLTEANSAITSNTSYFFTYYPTLTDAQNGTGSLPNIYTNTISPIQVLYVVISNSANCTSIVELTLTVNPPPSITLQIDDETCLGDGDGSVTINSPTGVNYSLDNSTWSTNNIFDNLISGNYTAYIEDGNGCSASQNFDINPGLEITMSSFDITCNDNGTASDATDDNYNITFTLTNNNGNVGTFSVFDGSLNITSLNYNQSNTISLPAQGQSLTLTFTDENANCSITQAVGPLNPCSTDCSISIDQLDITCSDNGTSNDLSDDIYTVTINTSAINGAANNTYNVLINGVVNFNYTYNNAFTFTIPADGSSPIISVVDNQDSQCQATQTIGPLVSCSDPCIINFDLVEVICNDNGTITDPTDDFYDINIQASAVNAGASNSFEIFANNISQGTFDYTTGGMFTLPADGSAVLILIQDADEPLCSAEQNIGTLEPCDEDCTINATVSNILCDDNGTGNDDTDDTFTFDLLVSGQNIGTGWQSTDGTLAGGYGAVQNFGPFLIANGDLNFDLQDLTTLTCMTSISTNAPVTCSDPCIINFDLVEVICIDNGTITDPTDDFYDINIQASAVNAGASNSFEIFANNISQGTFDYATGGMFTLPADGSAVQILIQDADEPLCSVEQNIGTLEPCDEDCNINATISNIVCDDNGTGNDDTDDTFTFDLLVSGQNIGTGWQSTDGTLAGGYGAVQNFGPFSIANGDLNFDLQDLTTLTCITSISVNALATCSDPCVINFDLVDVVCNDNGTITDPTDDFYDINIQASAVNAGASNSFEIFANNISQGTFDYATGGMFTLPADGSAVLILIQDTDEPLCSAEQNIGTLEPCNEDCTINATVSNIVCDDNGTGNDDTDDMFTFDLLVSGQNIGSSWQSTDGTLAGNYSSTQNFGSFLIANGDLNFELQDLTTLTCMTSISTNAPATCSDPCVINFDLVDVVCNDNGTITDPTDDFYDINIQVSTTNAGASNSFEIFANNISQGTFDYATGGIFTLPADGSAVLILIQDADEPLCFAEQNIGTLEPCDEDCSINATISNIVCDDNGTGNDDTDDTFTFDLLVSGQNIGTGWQSTDGTLAGGYGAVQNFGPFSIANGDLNFDLQDLTTLTCMTSISVNAPSTCSSCPQTVDAGTGSTLTCNNTIANLNGSSSTVGNYLWTGPNSFSSMDLITTTTMPGWYFLTATYSNNCTATDSVFIEIENGAPVANAGPDQTITCDISEVILNGSASTGANLEFEWTTTAGVFISNSTQITTTTTGVYNLQLTDSVSGCTSTDQVEVFENTDLPSAVIYADPDNILDCVVSSITLTSDNEPNVIYSWNSIITTQYIVTEGSVVDLIALDTISGCENYNQITITDIQDYPFVNLNPPSPISCYEPNTLIDGSNSQQNANIIYNWFDANNNLIVGQNGNTLLVDNGGFYYLQLIDTINGCENTDSVFVESLLNVPLAQAMDDITLFCGETETNLNVNILGSTDDLDITWTTSNGNIVSGANTQNPFVNQSGIYTVSIQDIISGCITTDNLEVIINSNIPQLMTANIYNETCFEANDGLIVISNISGGESPFTYTLNGNPTDNSGQFQNLAPGFYNIILTDNNGCTLSDNFTINPGINLELSLPEVIEILEGNSSTIQALVNIPVDSLDYIQWTPPELLSCDTCLTTTIQTLDDQTFQLTIIDNNGCIAIAVINIIVIPQVRIYIPNVFSPNFNGHNDYFTLFSNDQVEEILELSIFDRWGEHVFKKENFQPNDPILGWDGRFKGEEMNPAVFVYIFEVKLKDGSTRVFSGDVTLKK